MYHGLVARFFKWPYHANVMKMFDAVRRSTVFAMTDIPAVLPSSRRPAASSEFQAFGRPARTV
jgi:hypothetical protein